MTTALLAAGTGTAARLLAAWSSDNGAHWKLSPPLPLHSPIVASAASGPANGVAVILTDRHAAAITSGAGSWRMLPPVPPGTATLAPGPASEWDALTAHGNQLTVWHASPGGAAWASGQVIKVPVQFGSSG